MSKGYEKLIADVKRDCENFGGVFHTEGCCKCGGDCTHRYCDKFKWVIDRAKAYGEATGLNWEDILDSWEQDRNYWYMNYYQECNQPSIKSSSVRVFDTLEDFRVAVGEKKFRCPSCGKITTNPYECKACDCKVYGFFGDLGKGVFVYVKEKLKGKNIFMPISWEDWLKMSEIKLKPCPFCGGEGILNNEKNRIFSYVKCQTCGAETGLVHKSAEYCSDKRAAERWNRRVENGKD